jgi:hypothetical protein
MLINEGANIRARKGFAWALIGHFANRDKTLPSDDRLRQFNLSPDCRSVPNDCETVGRVLACRWQGVD